MLTPRALAKLRKRACLASGIRIVKEGAGRFILESDSGVELDHPRPIGLRRDLAETCGGNGCTGATEDGMVEDVDGIALESQLHSFSDFEVPPQAHVWVIVRRVAKPVYQ